MSTHSSQKVHFFKSNTLTFPPTIPRTSWGHILTQSQQSLQLSPMFNSFNSFTLSNLILMNDKSSKCFRQKAGMGLMIHLYIYSPITSFTKTLKYSMSLYLICSCILPISSSTIISCMSNVIE